MRQYIVEFHNRSEGGVWKPSVMFERTFDSEKEADRYMKEAIDTWNRMGFFKRDPGQYRIGRRDFAG